MSSKKKAFSGSTMTLKDFHGGSIPSELILPSAPGVTARPQDRAGLERGPGAWGRGDPHRLSRPGSSGGVAPTRGTLDEASSPFLPRIGRSHFDEDERKPFDASSAPRRLAAPDPEPPRLQPKPYSRPTTSPAAVGGDAGFPAVAATAQQPPAAPSAPPNAWGVRRESASDPQPPPPVSAALTASRFAQASAVEKISSGRWQTRPSPVGSPEIGGFAELDRSRGGGVVHDDVRSEVRSGGRGVDIEGSYNGFASGRFAAASKSSGGLEVRGMNSGGEFQYSSPPASREGRSGNVPVRQQEEFQPQLQGRVGDLQVNQRGYSDGLVVHQEGEFFGGVRGAQQVDKFGGSRGQHEILDVQERPKLKLLPRTKPLEASITQDSDNDKQGLQHQSAEIWAPDSLKDIHISPRTVKSGTAGADGMNEMVERPRLNLKPRSQPIGHSNGSFDREKNLLFGGARPRELVLKERGIETDHIKSPPSPADSRSKHELPRVTNTNQDSAASVVHQTKKAESYTTVYPSGKDRDRKDFRAEPAKLDGQSGTRGNDNRRNGRDYEKSRERRPEAESWRKPVEEQKPDIVGPRFGKAASALELAHAFSRSASVPDAPKSNTRLASGQRVVSGHKQVPFSRLTEGREIYQGTGSRKINGY